MRPRFRWGWYLTSRVPLLVVAVLLSFGPVRPALWMTALAVLAYAAGEIHYHRAGGWR